MKIQLVFILVLSLLSLTNTSTTCGGNCPDSSCTYCPCGSVKSYIPVDNYCLQSSVWNQNCCKCIASRLTGGNTNFALKIDTRYYVGVMKVLGLNTADQKAMCDPSNNAKDAAYIYQFSGWGTSMWEDTAKACGCLSMTADVASQEEVRQILMQKL